MHAVSVLADIRSEFPIFLTEELSSSVVYLDSAATSQKPAQVIDAMQKFLVKEYGTVHRALYSLSARATEKYNGVREKVRQFIGAASTEEIIFTRGTTSAINLVARSFGKKYFQEKDEILVLETEHHSNLVPWQMLCEEKGGVLRAIPVNECGELDLAVLKKMMSNKVKLIAIAYVSNATGAIHPIREVVEIAHRYGAKVLIDAAQSISHLPISVDEMNIDFLAFSAHKMYGPTGVGVLYGKKELLDQMPPCEGGGDMVEFVSFEKTTYQPLPLKFEAGTPSIVEVIGLGAAIDFMQRIGIEQIMEHEKALTKYALDQLLECPFVKLLCHPARRSSLISFNCEGCHPLDVGTLLDIRGVAVRTGHLCSQTTMKRFGVSSTIRISFGIYNTLEDIDFFASALKEVVSSLK
jgi:cysteine desulfurase/selenocysteine lyase